MSITFNKRVWIMNEFQLTHVALVGARISAFHPYGFHARNELTMRRITPDTKGESLQAMPEGALRGLLKSELPVWVHNILTDPEFPRRETLLMPLRRFEGELQDDKDNEVVSAVLSAGFRDQTLDPLELPESMPMRQRCTMVMQVSQWQEAYRQLEHDVIDILVTCPADLDTWLASAREPGHALVE